MAAGDRWIDCNNVDNETFESLFKQLIRFDASGNPYINMWASGLTPTTTVNCDEEDTPFTLFKKLLVEDDDGNIALASFGT